MKSNAIKSNALNIIIDERLSLDAIDPAEFLRMTDLPESRRGGTPMSQRIFKDYILSSEAFQLDSHLKD